MGHLPLYNGSNYSLDTLKRIINLYKFSYIEQSWEKVETDIESSSSGYKSAFTQQCQQFGIEYKPNKKDRFCIQDYLINFEDFQLKQYIQFWSMTYYSPNARVKDKTDTPIIAFVELSEKILNEPNKKYNFDTFFNTFYNGTSPNILFATLKDYTMYIKLNTTTKEFYVENEDVDKLRDLVNKINEFFPIPVGPLGELSFFERYSESNFKKFYSKVIRTNIKEPNNKIVYGAPGTGKSHLIQEKLNQFFSCENYQRVTFYNGYTYGQFVGTFKPKTIYKNIVTKEVFHSSITISKEHEPIITYEFIAGPFIKLLVKALSDMTSNFCLIIEEINRTKVDTVFGDIFQLLDRDIDGKSSYTINPSNELLGYLKNNLPKSVYLDIELNGLYIPSNFYIWATMNSADQGVFPIDTAFKRRWSFEYISLNDKQAEMDKLDVNIGNNTFLEYNEFRKKINKKLSDFYHIEEDKLLAPFFVKKTDFEAKNISGIEKLVLKENVFINKIVMYLKDDILRHARNEDIFLYKTFSEIVENYPTNKIINETTL